MHDPAWRETPEGRRLLEALRSSCSRLPETTEVIDGFGHTTFKVRKKSFLIAGMGEENESISIKSDPVNQSLLVQRDGFYRTPYIGQHGWISVRDPMDRDWDEIEALIEDAYRMVAPRRCLQGMDGRSIS
jgi:predicted DNA-binding protein (MmcQ/YjbR family)